MPPSTWTSQRPSTTSTTSGSASMPAATPASWRPPWFETQTASTPPSTPRRASPRRDGVEPAPAVVRDPHRVGAVLDREERVLAREDPLDRERQPGLGADPL